MIFIDSNIWCYYFDKRLPEHPLVREPIRQTLLSSEELASSVVVVMEVAHYLVRHFSVEDARKKIEHFVNLCNMKILDFDSKLLSESVDYLLNYGYEDGLGGRDATIIAVINSQGIDTLLSHDDAFKRLADRVTFKVIDPVSSVYNAQK